MNEIQVDMIMTISFIYTCVNIGMILSDIVLDYWNDYFRGDDEIN